jgi:glutathione S-transferase
MLELYHSGLTTCSKQVRHCLREKGLAYASRYVELWRYENLSPAYLAINPNGVVPTLVHDGVPIINSFCINEYIEDAFPDPPLRPADAQACSRMRYWTWTADEIHQSLARLTHARMLQPALAGMTDADRDQLLAATPVPEKRARWRAITHGQYSPEQLQAGLDNVLFVLARMEGELVNAAWLAGGMFSLAEISMAAIVHRVFELYPDRIDRAALPRLNDWWDRIMSRPAAAYVYADGTEETPPRPARKSIDGIAEFQIGKAAAWSAAAAPV